MGHKIITEEDFWICSEGAMPSPFQGTRESLHDSSGHKYITKSDTSTISWIDFGCKKYMLLMALIAAVAVVAAVAIGVLTVATGGAGLILLGAVAGLVGGAIGAVIGGLLCGHKMGPARTWDSKKPDMILQGTPVITGGCTMTCKAGGTIQYAPNIKSWMGAIGYASISYGSELVKCAFVGAAVGTVGSLLGVGSVTVAGTGGSVGTGISLSRASMILARPTVASVLSNIGTSFGIGAGWSGAGIALGSRGIFGAESAAKTYATDAVDENGEPISVGDSFAKGALPEYELGSRIADKGVSGLQWSDALLGLYFLNLKVDPPGTFRDANGTLRNSRGNPNGLKPGTTATDPRKVKSGGTGKAYEDNRPSHTDDAINDTYNNNKDVDGKVYDPETGEEIIWSPGQPRQGVWSMGHKPHYEYRHLRKAYMEGRITKEEFLKYFNDPKYYRPETPTTSSKGLHESEESWYDFDN
jgi:hypothetical protein